MNPISIASTPPPFCLHASRPSAGKAFLRNGVSPLYSRRLLLQPPKRRHDKFDGELGAITQRDVNAKTLQNDEEFFMIPSWSLHVPFIKRPCDEARVAANG